MTASLRALVRSRLTLHRRRPTALPRFAGSEGPAPFSGPLLLCSISCSEVRRDERTGGLLTLSITLMGVRGISRNMIGIGTVIPSSLDYLQLSNGIYRLGRLDLRYVSLGKSYCSIARYT